MRMTDLVSNYKWVRNVTCVEFSSRGLSSFGGRLGSRVRRVPFCLCLWLCLERCEGCLGGRSGEGEGTGLSVGQDFIWDLASCVTWIQLSVLECSYDSNSFRNTYVWILWINRVRMCPWDSVLKRFIVFLPQTVPVNRSRSPVLSRGRCPSRGCVRDYSRFVSLLSVFLSRKYL